jgi:long-chain fatty acid transport protein
MFRFSSVCLFGALLGVLAAGDVSAQGFGVYEQGACMMGRGGAGVADPCRDGSGVYFNPAGLSFESKQLTLGGTLIGPSGSFLDTSGGSLNGTVSTLNKAWYPVPNFYFSMPFAKKYAFGIGVFAPYGLTTDWPVTSQGRYLGYKSVVQGVYLQPTLSAKLNDKFSVGAGLDLTYLNVELRQRVDLSVQTLPTGATFAALGVLPGTDFADVRLAGNQTHAGVHLGLIYKANERFSFGMRFLSGQKVTVKDGAIATTQIPAVKPDGTPYVLPITIPGVAPAGTKLDLLVAPQFATGGKLSNQSASAALPLPAQFVAGVSIQATPKVKLLFDYQYTNWSSFDVLAINGQYLQSTIAENYNNASGFRAGADFAVGAKSVIRAGLNIHGPAAPDQTVTPNLPEGSRREFTAGFGSELSKKIRLDFFYMYLHQPDRAGRTLAMPNNGVYSFMANLFGASMTFGF